jgi:hypothetical protein
VKNSPDSYYSVQHFLEDEARLLASTQHESSLPPDCIQTPDGRLLPLPTLPLLAALESQDRATDAFLHRYGPDLGADHFERFRLVLDFIASHQSEMKATGLAASREPLAIREEFLDFLLNVSITKDAARIPDTVLGRFLDEWGTRWI